MSDQDSYLARVVAERHGSMMTHVDCETGEYWIGVTWIANADTFPYRFSVKGPNCPTIIGAEVSLLYHLKGIRVI